MVKLGFDIDDHRKEAQRKTERAEEMNLKYEANAIAADGARTAQKALLVATVSTALSLIAIVVAIVK